MWFDLTKTKAYEDFEDAIYTAETIGWEIRSIYKKYRQPGVDYHGMFYELVALSDEDQKRVDALMDEEKQIIGNYTEKVSDALCYHNREFFKVVDSPKVKKTPLDELCPSTRNEIMDTKACLLNSVREDCGIPGMVH